MINIIGAGLSGLSAAITLAEHGCPCRLFSLQPSERAQSVLAEGGINAALDTMGENDCIEDHFMDTIKGGVWLADPNAVDNLTQNAPQILRWLEHLGVPFHRTDKDIMLRNFGGQKKKRTAYARSSTGKIIMTAVIDEARKYEASGLIERYSHHAFIHLLMEHQNCTGVRIQDSYSGRLLDCTGAVVLCSGGMNGMFPNMTTGTTQNTGDVTATVFAQGAALGNLEMLQYHPTTIGISGKRCLVTEAARGEGGRLYISRQNTKWYFMEEKYPELKNLMPRDVVSREMYFVRRLPECGNQVYLDMTTLPEETWQDKLFDLRSELLHYLKLDPKTEPIPVQEGIHYFMGGIDTDAQHRTNLKNVYAAGECCCQYHGANRLGGNSMLGALYGGRKAAESVLEDTENPDTLEQPVSVQTEDVYTEPVSPVLIADISRILLGGLGIVRNETDLCHALSELQKISARRTYTIREQHRLHLAEAMLLSALYRRESRGAHYREDYPSQDAHLQKTTLAVQNAGHIRICFRDIPERGCVTNDIRNSPQN